MFQKVYLEECPQLQVHTANYSLCIIVSGQPFVSFSFCLQIQFSITNCANHETMQ